jgi:uncharacterized protein (DUF779 family)
LSFALLVHVQSGECKVGAKKVMYKCDTYVVGAYMVALGFNLDEIVVNSDGHKFNE